MQVLWKRIYRRDVFNHDLQLWQQGRQFALPVRQVGVGPIPPASRPLRRVPRLGDRQQRPTDDLDRPVDAGTVLRRGVMGQLLQFQQPIHPGQQGVNIVFHVTAINHPPVASS
jgi:hypothetical protein